MSNLKEKIEKIHQAIKELGAPRFTPNDGRLSGTGRESYGVFGFGLFRFEVILTDYQYNCGVYNTFGDSVAFFVLSSLNNGKEQCLDEMGYWLEEFDYVAYYRREIAARRPITDSERLNWLYNHSLFSKESLDNEVRHERAKNSSK